MQRPKDENGMFFVGMEFTPTEDMKQADVNRLIVHIFRQLYKGPDGQMLEVKEYDKSIHTLVQFLLDLKIQLNEEAFGHIPDDLKRFFTIIHRDGTKYRHGTKPRF